jgi:hypothetical protein
LRERQGGVHSGHVPSGLDRRHELAADAGASRELDLRQTALEAAPAQL